MSEIKLAIIVSYFNSDITEKLLEGALTRCEELKISKDDVTIIRVPGAVEIPLTAKLLARTDRYEAIICLGAVIRGETDHYDYVCQQVSNGCQHVMMEYNLPVIFGVLTTDNEEQALERVGGKHGHKGRECVDAAVEMIKVLASIESGE